MSDPFCTIKKENTLFGTSRFFLKLHMQIAKWHTTLRLQWVMIAPCTHIHVWTQPVTVPLCHHNYTNISLWHPMIGKHRCCHGNTTPTMPSRTTLSCDYCYSIWGKLISKSFKGTFSEADMLSGVCHVQIKSTVWVFDVKWKKQLFYCLVLCLLSK